MMFRHPHQPPPHFGPGNGNTGIPPPYMGSGGGGPIGTTGDRQQQPMMMMRPPGMYPGDDPSAAAGPVDVGGVGAADMGEFGVPYDPRGWRPPMPFGAPAFRGGGRGMWPPGMPWRFGGGRFPPGRPGEEPPPPPPPEEMEAAAGRRRSDTGPSSSEDARPEGAGAGPSASGDAAPTQQQQGFPSGGGDWDKSAAAAARFMGRPGERPTMMGMPPGMPPHPMMPHHPPMPGGWPGVPPQYGPDMMGMKRPPGAGAAGFPPRGAAAAGAGGGFAPPMWHARGPQGPFMMMQAVRRRGMMEPGYFDMGAPHELELPGVTPPEDILEEECATELQAFLDLEVSRDLRIHAFCIHLLDQVQPTLVSRETCALIESAVPPEARRRARRSVDRAPLALQPSPVQPSHPPLVKHPVAITSTFPFPAFPAVCPSLKRQRRLPSADAVTAEALVPKMAGAPSFPKDLAGLPLDIFHEAGTTATGVRLNEATQLRLQQFLSAARVAFALGCVPSFDIYPTMAGVVPAPPVVLDIWHPDPRAAYPPLYTVPASPPAPPQLTDFDDPEMPGPPPVFACSLESHKAPLRRPTGPETLRGEVTNRALEEALVTIVNRA